VQTTIGVELKHSAFDMVLVFLYSVACCVAGCVQVKQKCGKGKYGHKNGYVYSENAEKYLTTADFG